MKAIVDQDTCTGCTLCASVCPEVFRMEEDQAVAYVDVVPDDVKDSCKDAADQCPVDAISIKE